MSTIGIQIVQLIKDAQQLLENARHLGLSKKEHISVDDRAAVKIATDAVALQNKKLRMDVGETDEERYARLHG